jgi:hypothetical protein
MRIPLADVDGVAIGRGAREPTDTDAATSAADILNDDRLRKYSCHACRQYSSHRVSGAAMRKRHNESDGFSDQICTRPRLKSPLPGAREVQDRKERSPQPRDAYFPLSVSLMPPTAF